MTDTPNNEAVLRSAGARANEALYLDDDTAAVVCAQLDQGRSLRSVAAELEVTPMRLSRWCQRIGFVPLSLASDIEQARKRIAAAHVDLMGKFLADALNIHRRLWEPYETAINSMDGPRSVILDEPDAQAVKHFSIAIARLTDLHIRLSETVDGARPANAPKSVLEELHDSLKAFAAQEESSDHDVTTT